MVANEGSSIKSNFGAVVSSVYDFWQCTFSFLILHPQGLQHLWCLLGAHEGHQMNEQSLESGLPGFSLLTPTL